MKGLIHLVNLLFLLVCFFVCSFLCVCALERAVSSIRYDELKHSSVRMMQRCPANTKAHRTASNLCLSQLIISVSTKFRHADMPPSAHWLMKTLIPPWSGFLHFWSSVLTQQPNLGNSSTVYLIFLIFFLNSYHCYEAKDFFLSLFSSAHRLKRESSGWPWLQSVSVSNLSLAQCSTRSNILLLE